MKQLYKPVRFMTTFTKKDMWRCHCGRIIQYRNRYRHWEESCMAEMSEAHIRYLLREKL